MTQAKGQKLIGLEVAIENISDHGAFEVDWLKRISENVSDHRVVEVGWPKGQLKIFKIMGQSRLKRTTENISDHGAVKMDWA